MSFHIAPNPHATYSSSVDQSIVNPVNAQVVTFDTTIAQNGITLADNSKFTLPQIGNYIFSVSAVVTNTTGGDHTASLWFRKNGTDVDNSNTYMTVPKNQDMIFALVLDLPCTTAGDYYEIWFAGENVGVKLNAYPAVTGSVTYPPNQPASPSIIVSIGQIG